MQNGVFLTRRFLLLKIIITLTHTINEFFERALFLIEY